MAHFIVIGYDGTDVGALDRRMAAREAHLKMGEENFGNGRQFIGAALLDETGKMNGSAMVMNFETRAELDAWLATEPYVNGKVWDKIQVIPCKIPDMFLKATAKT